MGTDAEQGELRTRKRLFSKATVREGIGPANAAELDSRMEFDVSQSG